MLLLFFDAQVVMVDNIVVEGAELSGSVIYSDDVLLLPIQGMVNGRMITVTLQGVNGGSGTTEQVQFTFSRQDGDLNHDGTVDVADIAVWSLHQGIPVSAANCQADVNRDGLINLADFLAIKAHEGENCFGSRHYTGHHRHDKSGLHLTLYRAYDADNGRWLSRDPIAESGGLNLYGYVSNNPINLKDPYGLWAGVDDVFTGPVDEAIVIGGLALAAYLGCEPCQKALDSLLNAVGNMFDDDGCPDYKPKTRGKGPKKGTDEYEKCFSCGVLFV